MNYMSDAEEERLEKYLEMMKELPKWSNNAIMFGHEIYHVNIDGSIREIHPMSKEGQELLNKLDEEV